MKILVIDDDRGLRRSLSMILEDQDYTVVQASNGVEGLAAALDVRPAMILCDVRMPEMDGLEFLDRYRAEGGTALVLVMTAYGSSDLAVEAMKKGAYDYIPKPFGADEVVLTVRKAEERENLRREVGRLRDQVRADRKFGDMVARSKSMLDALQVATKVAPHESPFRPEWYGKGTRRSPDPPGERSCGRPLRGGQLRSDPRESSRERVLRTCEGGVHRSGPGPRGAVRIGTDRHTIPR